MTTHDLLARCHEAGIVLALDGGNLCVDAPRGALDDAILSELRAHKSDILAALAHPNLPGLSPEFRAGLSAEGLDDIATGALPLGTVQAFEQAAIAREAEDLREFFEERAVILEFDAGLPRPDAELEAARITATLARNRGYLWASLRVALTGYPVLLAQVPQKAGPVDALPFGVPKLAVLKNQRVVRQGAFSGVPEVKA
jgi:TubC N-terminal docking domain